MSLLREGSFVRPEVGIGPRYRISPRTGGDVGATLWAFPGTVLPLVGVLGLVIAVLGALLATRSLMSSLTV